MKLETKRILNKTIAVAALFCMTAQGTSAALLNLSQAPLFTGSNVPPKVMLTISKDQQLYKKAYNDYTDLDADGTLETTYKHSIDYYGYFDPTKCYRYQNGRDRFEPQRVSATKLCGGANEWSGNFLNWVSMSRMDAVRKLLYGGMRSTDETFASRGVNAETVLERSYLPTDAHAWAKHYNPQNGIPTANQPAVNLLTPFNPPAVPVVNGATTSPAFTIPVANADVVIPFQGSQNSRMQPGDQILMARTAAPGQYFIAVIRAMDGSGQNVTVRVNTAGISAGAGGVSDTSWRVSNLSSTGISFCNLTRGGGGTDQVSTTNAQPPLLRVAQGNFGLWNANERWQCYWAGERQNLQGGFNGVRSNGNQGALSEIYASAENPIQSGAQAHSLGNGSAQGEFVARVQVCVGTLIGSEKCKVYPNGTRKPIGLLQEYGDRDRIHFGLMTGSHAKNVSGGVLRKNTASLTDEVNVNTDGTFREPYRPPSSPRNTGSTATTAGIINTLNYMRIYGYNYADGSYLGAAGDNCTYQLTNIIENNCTSWGNPMSEVFFEAVRYFASPKDGTGTPLGPTTAYTYTNNGSKDNQLGLPLATWSDQVSQAFYCTPLNILVFNASVSSNDDDLRGTSAAQINGAGTVRDLTNIVGGASGENIDGGSYFVGKILGVPPGPGFELCSAKTVPGLGDVSGICPEGPTVAGSFLIAGVAHHAHTTRIRTDITVPVTEPKPLKVTTYGVQLATNVPQIVVQVPPVDAQGRSLAGRTVVIQPIYRLDLGAGGFGGGALVDMRFVRQDVAAGTGKIYVNWEDSEQGGDYDQDMWGIIEWSLSGGNIAVTTNAISFSTGNPQGFGYAISGTTQDGAHFHSGILGFNFSDPGVLAQPANFAGCNNCRTPSEGVVGSQVGAQTVTYTLGAATAAPLKDPLWYAAKYGGFSDTNNDGFPNTAAEWDRSGPTGAFGADGDPDNYFLVTNPLGLEIALALALDSILRDGSGSALAANSTSLQTLNALYQAKFKTTEWSGSLEALRFDPLTRLIDATPAWDAGVTLSAATTDPNDRAIIAFDSRVTARQGVPFRWPGVSTLAVGLELDKNPDSGAPDTRGQQRLEYLRGDRTLETGVGAIFRARTSRLGDIVNSSPVYVGPPAGTAVDVNYQTFRNNNIARKPMVYVGANDGMLHGFEADPDAVGRGKERLAYMPSKTFANLNKLTSPNYVHRYYVDGAIDVQDALVNNQWKSVLVGGLGGGGQGIYALDVTNPDGSPNGPAFSEANANQLLLWEFNDSDDSALGFTYGKPVIRKMANNRWAAIVSGGYNNSDGDTSGASTTGRAFLFIIFLDGPKGPNRSWREVMAGNTGDYIKITTNVGSVSTPNGLAPPFAADTNRDGNVDFVYAGDLYGNFWKFDVSSPTAADWKLSQNRVTLFQARDPVSNAIQPITAAAEGTTHPTGRGYVITFGTGKYLEFTDTISPYLTNSFYGIWDKNDPIPGFGGIWSQTRVTNRNQLLAQTITAETTVGSQQFRTLSQNPAVWSTDLTPPFANDSPTNDMGWVIDFLRTIPDGERVITAPVLQSSRLIFATNIPSNSTCSFGGSGYLMVVNPTTGGRIDSAVLDVDGNGILNILDRIAIAGINTYASGRQMAVGASGTPTVIAPGGGGVIGGPATTPTGGIALPPTTGRPVIDPLGLPPDTGRVTWREILTP